MSGIAYNCNTTSHSYKGKVGDVLGFSLDFESGIGEIFFNGISTNINFSITKGGNYWPVVHLFYVNDGFTFRFPKDFPNSKVLIQPQVNTYFQWNTNATNQSMNFTVSKTGSVLTVKKIGGANSWKTSHVYGTQSYSSGKQYFEVTVRSVNNDGSGYVVGLSKNNTGSTQFNQDLAIGLTGASYGLTGGQHGKKGKSGDVIGLSLDFEEGRCKFYYNGTLLNCWAVLEVGVSYWPVVHMYYVGDSCSIPSNAGGSGDGLEAPNNSLWN